MRKHHGREPEWEKGEGGFRIQCWMCGLSTPEFSRLDDAEKFWDLMGKNKWTTKQAAQVHEYNRLMAGKKGKK